MSLFKFDKWFFDVLLLGNTYIFFYLAITSIFKKNTIKFNIYSCTDSGYECISKGIRFRKGIKEYDNSVIVIDEGSIVFKNSEVNINLRFGDLIVHLSYRANQYNVLEPLEIFRRKNSLTWKPILIKGFVNGHVSLHSLTTPVNNAPGYIDHVSSSIFPFNVPIRKLFWGRLHHNKLDLTYTITYTKMDSLTAKLFLWFDRKIYTYGNVTIDIKKSSCSNKMKIAYPDNYILKGNQMDNTVEIKIQHVKLLIEDDFISGQQGISGIKTKVLEYISRNPRGSKFISKANVRIKFDNEDLIVEDVYFIDEYVIFN